MQRVQQGSIGVRFVAELVDQAGKALELAGFDELELVFLPPKGAARVREATVSGETANGLLEYTSAAGDLDQFGEWRFQPRVVESGAQPEDPPVREHRGLAIPFQVVENLDG